MKDKPAVDLAAVPRDTAPPVTELEKEAFLEAMVRLKSWYAAAVAARPYARDKKSAWAVFRRLVEKDREFCSRFEQACVDALGTVESEIHRRALEGVVEYERYEKGELVEKRIKYDSKLLLASAARLSQKIEPGAWDKRTTVDVQGGTHNTVELEVSDLSREVRDRILEAVRAKKALQKAKDGNVE